MTWQSVGKCVLSMPVVTEKPFNTYLPSSFFHAHFLRPLSGCSRFEGPPKRLASSKPSYFTNPAPFLVSIDSDWVIGVRYHIYFLLASRQLPLTWMPINWFKVSVMNNFWFHHSKKNYAWSSVNYLVISQLFVHWKIMDMLPISAIVGKIIFRTWSWFKTSLP